MGGGVKWNWHIVWEMAVAMWGNAFSISASHVWNTNVIGMMCVDESFYREFCTCEIHVANRFVTSIMLHVWERHDATYHDISLKAHYHPSWYMCRTIYGRVLPWWHLRGWVNVPIRWKDAGMYLRPLAMFDTCVGIFNVITIWHVSGRTHLVIKFRLANEGLTYHSTSWSLRHLRQHSRC